MEWRCEWCEKPHEENDPPCDNCGHSSFEKAVVPMGPESTDDGNPVVWACTECGREHQKHSPPCSRCGNATLEQREADYSDVENLTSTGWRDILTRTHLAGFAVVGVLALVLGLGVVGVVDLPVVGGPPSPPAVPGENESINGVSLLGAEDAFVDQVNAQRETAGATTLARGHTLDTMATYFNRRTVESEYEGAESPTVSELEPFDPDCLGSPDIRVLNRVFPGMGQMINESADGRWDAEETGQTLVGAPDVLSGESFGSVLRGERRISSIGVDIHVGPDDEIYVTAVYC